MRISIPDFCLVFNCYQYSFSFFRHCQRFLPIAGSCHATNEDIKKLSSELFKSTFFAEDATPSKVGRVFVTNSQKCYLVGISYWKKQTGLLKLCLFVFSYTFDLTEELAGAFAHSSSFNRHPLPLCDML